MHAAGMMGQIGSPMKGHTNSFSATVAAANVERARRSLSKLTAQTTIPSGCFFHSDKDRRLPYI